MAKSADRLATILVGMGRTFPDTNGLVRAVDLPCFDFLVVHCVGRMGFVFAANGRVFNSQLDRFHIRSRCGFDFVHATRIGDRCVDTKRYRFAGELHTRRLLVVVVWYQLHSDVDGFCNDIG